MSKAYEVVGIVGVLVLFGLIMLGGYACSQVVPCSMLTLQHMPANRIAECVGR